MEKGRKWYMAMVLALGLIWISASVSEAGGLITRQELSLGLAKKMADAALSTCDKNGWGATVVIVDDHGNLKLLQRSDKAHTASIRVGIGKATSAAIFRNTTARLQEVTRPDQGGWGLQFTPGILPLRGGLPIKLGAETLGAIGVSGAPGGDKDEICAQAGLDVFAAETK